MPILHTTTPITSIIKSSYILITLEIALFLRTLTQLELPDQHILKSVTLYTSLLTNTLKCIPHQLFSKEKNQ